MARFWQIFSRPSMQLLHVPQLQKTQGTPTRVPRIAEATPAPSSTTRPTISWPGIRGRLINLANAGQSPLMRCRSEWQTPQASIWSRTSPSPGCDGNILDGKRLAKFVEDGGAQWASPGYR